MDGEIRTPNGSPPNTVKNRLNGHSNGVNVWMGADVDGGDAKTKALDCGGCYGWLTNAHFMRWRAEDVLGVARAHPVLCAFAAAMMSFMGVEYTLAMVPATSVPFDLGFVATRGLHRVLAEKQEINTLLAGLNTVFVGMQTMYILWTWLVEGRPRATISAIFMFTCRGILGYSTQLPLPPDFLGSGVDFPVGNVSFFLFYSGHVAASVIASLDMRRVKRMELARVFDTLNILQIIRLLSTRGHYTIDLAAGVGAGILFDSLAGKYEESTKMIKKEKLLLRSKSTGAMFSSMTKEGQKWSDL